MRRGLAEPQQRSQPPTRRARRHDLLPRSHRPPPHPPLATISRGVKTFCWWKLMERFYSLFCHGRLRRNVMRKGGKRKDKGVFAAQGPRPRKNALSLKLSQSGDSSKASAGGGTQEPRDLEHPTPRPLSLSLRHLHVPLPARLPAASPQAAHASCPFLAGAATPTGSFPSLPHGRPACPGGPSRSCLPHTIPEGFPNPALPFGYPHSPPCPQLRPAPRSLNLPLLLTPLPEGTACAPTLGIAAAGQHPDGLPGAREVLEELRLVIHGAAGAATAGETERGRRGSPWPRGSALLCYPSAHSAGSSIWFLRKRTRKKSGVGAYLQTVIFL